MELKIVCFMSLGGCGRCMRWFKGCVDDCLRLELCILQCVLMGSKVASLFMMIVLVSCVCPVAILAIVFCEVWR